ncbi:MAG: hypothetical protein EON91_09065 [Brevundimonas sp.]|uniref:hypothetical protein n=1 Tax=Brevundimonas sp. TaxID=1871086 RepID=UPI00120DB3F8|nr:hypothetical protein [Brevundimonas sp.]RZJ17482.1 MAG: hypothetical protein EON91_09065 [Brevundimonas sp.]
MTKDWAKFWLAVAIMMLAGAISANSILASPLEIGALAQWASAIATVSAVIVALRNTHYTIVRSEEKEENNKKRKEEAYTASVIVLSDQVHQSLRMMNTYMGSDKRSPSIIKRLSAVYGFVALIDRMDRIPIHECHNVILIEVLASMRMAAHNAQFEIDEAVEGGVETAVPVDNEIELLASARDSLREAFPALFAQISVEE